MRHLLFLSFLLAGINTIQAQKAPQTWEQMMVGDWKLDSVSLDNAASNELEESVSDENPIFFSFSANRKLLLFIERNWTVMNYDLSMNERNKFMHVSGVMMLYFEVRQISPTNMELFFQMPRTESDGMHIYASRQPDIDSMPTLFMGVLKGEMPKTRMPVMEERPEIHLLPGNRMECNFGIPDSGQWRLDHRKMELFLYGQLGTYHFDVITYYNGHLKLQTQKGPGLGPGYDMRHEPYYEGMESEGPELVTEEGPVEEMPMEPPMPPDMDQQKPKSPQEMLGHSWKSDEDTWLVFTPDGKVTYIDGKKEYKGTWEISEGFTSVLVFNWDKRPEMANFFVETNYDGVKDTDVLNISFVPPGGKELKRLGFIKQDPK